MIATTAKRTGYLLVGVIAIIALTHAVTLKSSAVMKIRLDRHTFAIPERYSLEGTIPAWLQWLPGLDSSSRDILLEFPAEEIKVNVRAYRSHDGQLEENITARLAVLSSVEVDRYRDAGRFRDLWNGEDSYLERIIEPYGDRPWFKVFRKIEYPYSWAVLKRAPAAGEALPNDVSDFWIGQCLTQNSPLTVSEQHTSCQTYVIIDDVVIDFKVAEQNLDVIDDIKAYLKAKILEWKQPV